MLRPHPGAVAFTRIPVVIQSFSFTKETSRSCDAVGHIIAAIILMSFLLLPSFGVIAEESISDSALQKKLNDMNQKPSTDQNNDLEIIEANTTSALLDRFLAEHPNARKHTFALKSIDHSAGGPAIELKNIWADESATLALVVGLHREGNDKSAVMRRDTLSLVDSKGHWHHLLEFSGAQEIRDVRGGSAIIIHPSDQTYLLFEAVDDYHPFTMRHSVESLGELDYFGKLDPRFQNRYDDAYHAAVTPEKMKDFIVEFARNDPDNRVRGVFVKFIQLMRAQNSFEGYYHAYLLLQDPADLKAASKLARTTEHKAKVEHMAVTTLLDKSRLFTLSVKPNKTRAEESRGSCLLLCNYNFTAKRPVTGTITVALNPNSPIILQYGTYKVSFSGRVFVPRKGQRRSNWTGNFDGDKNESWSNDIVVKFSPPYRTQTINYNLGDVTLAFFQRGSAGGYEALWTTGDPQVTIAYQGVELVQ